MRVEPVWQILPTREQVGCRRLCTQRLIGQTYCWWGRRRAWRRWHHGVYGPRCLAGYLGQIDQGSLERAPGIWPQRGTAEEMEESGLCGTPLPYNLYKKNKIKKDVNQIFFFFLANLLLILTGAITFSLWLLLILLPIIVCVRWQLSHDFVSIVKKIITIINR